MKASAIGMMVLIGLLSACDQRQLIPSTPLKATPPATAGPNVAPTIPDVGTSPVPSPHPTSDISTGGYGNQPGPLHTPLPDRLQSDEQSAEPNVLPIPMASASPLPCNDTYTIPYPPTPPGVVITPQAEQTFQFALPLLILNQRDYGPENVAELSVSAEGFLTYQPGNVEKAEGHQTVKKQLTAQEQQTLLELLNRLQLHQKLNFSPNAVTFYCQESTPWYHKQYQFISQQGREVNWSEDNKQVYPQAYLDGRAELDKLLKEWLRS